MAGHDMAGWAAIRPRGPTTRPAAYAHDLAGGVCHDTIICIVTGGRLGCWVCRETNHDTTLRYGRAWTRPCDTAEHVPRYGRETRDTTARGIARDIACDTAGVCYDTAERKATIRPGEACDTAPSAPRHGQPSA